MRVDPQAKVLPIYQLLVGFVRLISFLLFAFGFSIALDGFIESITDHGLDFFAIVQSFSQTWFWTQIVSFMIVAGLVWVSARPIALVCTPKINLRHCQVCGYNLKGDTQKPCSECGHVPQTERWRAVEGTDEE